jgi:endothelin-converting enzyme/putative endopeptidase
MRYLCSVALVLAFACAARAQDRPITALPYLPGLDPNAMDTSADPCGDFYQYTCGGWMKNNPIPSDQPRWDVYARLAQDNQRFLWGILEDLGPAKRGRTAPQQKIGDYFAACMDEGAVERRGIQPLKPLLDRIARLRSTRELPALLGQLQLETGSSDLFFGFGSSQDYADATRSSPSPRRAGSGFRIATIT